VEVVSTLGAGDCFNGVFIAEVSKGTALVEACRKASAEASRWLPPILKGGISKKRLWVLWMSLVKQDKSISTGFLA